MYIPLLFYKFNAVIETFIIVGHKILYPLVREESIAPSVKNCFAKEFWGGGNSESRQGPLSDCTVDGRTISTRILSEFVNAA